MRILIAEDDRVTARILTSLLASWGHETAVAYDGESALEMITSQRAPYIALLDWMLPRMDGPEVCRRTRASLPLTPGYLILLTSRSAQADLVEGLDAGADRSEERRVGKECSTTSSPLDFSGGLSTLFSLSAFLYLSVVMSLSAFDSL